MTSLLLLALATLRARPAAAQSVDAEALFTEGEHLESTGHVAEACAAFEASNRIEPRAGTMIRLGQCREAQRRVASAWSAYKDALTRAKDPVKRHLAEARIAALEARLSTLTIVVPDASRIDGLVIVRNGEPIDPALWNRAIPIDGGVYTIGGRAPGHEEWTSTIEISDEADRASVEVPRFAALPLTTPSSSRSSSSASIVAHPRVDTDRPGRFTTRRKLAVSALALGATAVAGGIVFGLQARQLEADALALCPMPAACADADAARAKNRDGSTRALEANVAFGVGGVAAVGAAVLWLTGAPRDAAARVAITPHLRPNTTGIDVTVRF